MIALKVSLNGKRVCVAGADDLAVLSAIVTAGGKLGSKTVPARQDVTTGDICYSVGGLTARSDPKMDVHMWWKSVAQLKIGDVIQVEIMETDKPDRAKSKTKAKGRNAGQTKERAIASCSTRGKHRTSSPPGSRP